MNKYLICLLAMLFALPLLAQDPDPAAPVAVTEGLETAEEGGFTYHYYPEDPVGLRIYELENGIKVYLARHIDEPVIASAIAFHTGGKDDPADNTGLSHYLEHLLFKGTTRYGTKDYEKEKVYLDQISDTYDELRGTESEQERDAIFARIDSLSQLAAQYAIPNEYDRIVGALGAERTNAFTSHDMTAYINQIPKNQLESFLMLEAERFREPVLRLFHTELETVYEEKNRAIDSEYRRAYEAMMRALFPTHNYGQQTVLGKTDHLKRPDIKAIERYYKERYVANNMHIFMVGDLDFTQTIKAIEAHFGEFEPGELQDYASPEEKPISGVIQLEESGPGPERVSLGWRLPAATHPDMPALDVLSSLLSSDAGLIELELKQPQRVLEAGAYLSEREDYSVFSMYGSPKEGQTLEEVEEMLTRLLRRIASGEVDEQLMKSIIINERVSETRKQESAWWKMYSLLPVMSGVPYAQLATEVERLEQVSKADVQRVARTYLRPENYVVVYKRSGENTDLPKIKKPPITPVSIDRENMSSFAEELMNYDSPDIEPRFVNFSKDIQIDELNGRPLWYRKNDENNLFTLYVSIEMGERHDPMLPIAINYWQFLAPEGMTPEQYKQRMFMLGCDAGVSIGTRRSYVYVTGPSENMENALRLFTLKLKKPAPDPEALENLKKDILKERENAKKSKQTILYGGLKHYALYGKENPFNNKLSNDALQELEYTQLHQLLAKLLTVDQRIMYYGPKALAEFQTAAKPHFELLKESVTREEKTYTPLTTTQPKVIFAHYEMVQAQMLWLAPAMEWQPDQLGHMQMYEEYFSGSMNSVVFQEIRESKGLAYSAYAYLAEPDRPDEPVVSYAFIGTQADKVPDAVPAMQDILVNFRHSNVHFSAAKNAAIKKLRAKRSVRTQPFFQYLNAQDMELNQTPEELKFEQMQEVNLEDVQALHQKYLKDLNYTMVIIGDRERLDIEYLKSLGDFEEVDLETLFGY
ncbi:MAG: M16 family metallopeptidase [Bacteroidota bacterium]